MKERLQEILTRERLTPARFAELVGVQRSSVSHILSGRNKPSLDFLQKILINLEHISPDWLITGNGSYKRGNTANPPAEDVIYPKLKSESGRIPFPASQPVNDEDTIEYQKNTINAEMRADKIEGNDESPVEKEIKSQATNPNGQTVTDTKYKDGKIIMKTMLFYDDHTFEVFYPS